MTSGTSGDGFVIAEGGHVKCTIVSNGHDGQARELAKYLGQITGAPVPVVSNETDVATGGRIVLKKGPALDDKNKYIALQSYRLKTAGDRFTITAPHERSLYYGVFGFLEDHLDCRFYSRNEEYVPSRRDLALPPIDDAQKPAFQVRGAVWGVKPDDILGLKLRAGGLPFCSLLAGHNISTFADAKNNFEKHPNWYALRPDGSRLDWSLCGTSEGAAKNVARLLVEEYGKRKLA